MNGPSARPAPRPAPVKRVMAPAATVDRTHLYEKAGPAATVCVHAVHGFCVAMSAAGPVWSHGPGVGPVATRHPDWLRIAYAWTDEPAARDEMIKVATLAEWGQFGFLRLRCDVAESPQRGDHANVDETPLQYPSLEACQRAHGGFPLRAEHALDRGMRRSGARPPAAVTLPAAPGAERRVPA